MRDFLKVCMEKENLKMLGIMLLIECFGFAVFYFIIEGIAHG